MKKTFLALLMLISITVSLCLVSCDSKKSMVEDAIETLEKYWEDLYDEDEKPWSDADGHFEIKNTRVIKIKNNLKEDDEAFQYFGDVAYVIEFVLFTDYFAAAPYYKEYRTANSVAVYENGDFEVCPLNLFDLYTGHTFIYDYSGIIEEIVDYGNEFNCVKKLK